MKSALAQVIVVGTFPYPIHGAAFVNSLMHELFQSRIKRTKRIDTSVHVLGSYYAAKRRTMKRMFYLFSRLLVFCRGYVVLVTSILREGRGRSLVYIGLSAGAALRFDLLYVKTSCLLGAVVVLHHHSFKYVETADRYMNLMTSLHGNLTHLFLCSKMAQVMNELYPNLKEQSWRVVGNSWILPTSWSSSPEENQSKVTGGLTIGLLSNLSREKGFFRLIDIFEDLVRVGFNVRLKVAGTAEHEVASAIEDLIESHGSRVTFTGAIVGEQKRTWYRGIDVFVFPSTLTEAYPLVMVESLASGVPFFACARGCMPEVLMPTGWSFRNEEFESQATQKLSQLFVHPEELEKEQIKARELYIQLRRRDSEVLDKLLDSILSPGVRDFNK